MMRNASVSRITMLALAVSGALLTSACDDDKSSTPVAIGPECRPAAVPNKQTNPGDVHPALVGTYELTYFRTAGGAPFADGDTVTVVIGADNTLTIGDAKYCDPFVQDIGGTPNDTEIIWYDGDLEIGFAANINGKAGFNEINVGDYTDPQDAAGVIPGFLGQLRE